MLIDSLTKISLPLFGKNLFMMKIGRILGIQYFGKIPLSSGIVFSSIFWSNNINDS